MATLTELNQFLGSEIDASVMRNKIMGALLVAAQSIIVNASATVPQKAWARACFSDPSQFREQAFNAMLASNNTATVVQITSATDLQVQTAINAALPALTG